MSEDPTWKAIRADVARFARLVEWCERRERLTNG